uniref:Uncharacterized protein n=1 Tax=Anguilla anguilla TaxID=7936 RepID=A0A0E9QIW0_ANGAN
MPSLCPSRRAARRSLSRRTRSSSSTLGFFASDETSSAAL